MPPHPCQGQLREGWVKHIPTGEYRLFDVYDFSRAVVRGNGDKIFPPVCADYEQVEFEAAK
jgi:hypothetical protein